MSSESFSPDNISHQLNLARQVSDVLSKKKPLVLKYKSTAAEVLDLRNVEFANDITRTRRGIYRLFAEEDSQAIVSGTNMYLGFQEIFLNLDDGLNIIDGTAVTHQQELFVYTGLQQIDKELLQIRANMLVWDILHLRF